MNKILLIAIFIFVSNLIFSQNNEKEATWTTSTYYKELSNSYLETVIVEGNSYEEVRRKAKEEIIKRRGLTVGARVSFSADETQSIGLTVASKAVSEYWENKGGVYIGYFLFQTLRNPSLKYEPIQVTNQYPFSARVFVPGMAQLHRGSKGKALMFIGGEIALVGGAVIFEGLRASYDSKIGRTHNASERQSYINKVDNMQNVRNGFIAGAAALYVWNIIDGIVGKGKKHVVVGKASAQFTPYATPETTGISLAINF